MLQSPERFIVKSTPLLWGPISGDAKKHVFGRQNNELIYMMGEILFNRSISEELMDWKKMKIKNFLFSFFINRSVFSFSFLYQVAQNISSRTSFSTRVKNFLNTSNY